MKKISTLLAIAIAVLVFSSSSSAQYSMGNGSYMTGYGQVYGSLGYAMATQNLYNTIQNNLRQSMLRAAQVKRFGEARVRQAEEKIRRERSTSKPSATGSQSAELSSTATLPSVPKYYGRFRPDSSVAMAEKLSNLFEKPEERRQMKLVVETVQQLYREEAANKKWGNNIAGGMTFFLVVLSTVYHDTQQPNDEAVKAVFEAVNQAIDGVSDFAKASDKDKTALNDMLVGFTALPFLTYLEGKKEGNADTVKTAQILAGEMIKMVLETEPQNVRFDNNSLTISK